MFYPVDIIGNPTNKFDSPRFLSPKRLAGNLLNDSHKNDLVTTSNHHVTIYNIDLTPKPKPKKVEKEKAVEQIKDDEKSKRDEVRKEEIIEDIVDLLERTINPRKLMLASFEALLAIYSFVSGFIFLQDVKPAQSEIYQLFIVLIIFGIFDLLAFLAFILSCCQTQLALYRGLQKIGLRRGFQIICGFYKAVYLYSRIKYNDEKNLFYISPYAYRSTLSIFTLHLIITVSKYCCCR